MLKRLAGDTGEIADAQAPQPGDTPDRIVRKAILVHSGPNGEENTLSSSDGEISFDAERIQKIVDAQNASTKKLAAEYGGEQNMPIGAHIPILDQHADDSSNRILGRVTGAFSVETRDVPKVGKNVICAVAELTFLGSDTVSKVLDGRYYHLSVGIDEETNTLGELSVVIEPAAPGAMVLKKMKRAPAPKLKTKEIDMSKKVARLAKLSAMKTELADMAEKTKLGKERIRLAKRKTEITASFTKLMSERKMSPAEFKKIELVKLAKLDSESFDTVLSVFEARQPLLRAGQQGSTNAVVFTEVGTAEEREVKRLKAAAKKNLSAQGTKFKEEDKEEEEMEAKENDSSGAIDEVSSPDTSEMDDVKKMVEDNSAQIARLASMVEQLMEESDDNDSEEANPDKSELAADDKKDEKLDDEKGEK